MADNVSFLKIATATATRKGESRHPDPGVPLDGWVYLVDGPCGLGWAGGPRIGSGRLPWPTRAPPGLWNSVYLTPEGSREGACSPDDLVEGVVAEGSCEVGAVNEIHPGYVRYRSPGHVVPARWDDTRLADRCPNSGSSRGMRGTLYDFF